MEFAVFMVFFRIERLVWRTSRWVC